MKNSIRLLEHRNPSSSPSSILQLLTLNDITSDSANASGKWLYGKL